MDNFQRCKEDHFCKIKTKNSALKINNKNWSPCASRPEPRSVNTKTDSFCVCQKRAGIQEKNINVEKTGCSRVVWLAMNALLAFNFDRPAKHIPTKTSIFVTTPRTPKTTANVCMSSAILDTSCGPRISGSAVTAPLL